MAAWWQTLTTLEHVLLYIAVPATLILVIQTVLLFVGGGMDDGGAGSADADGLPGGDADFDAAADLDADGSFDPDGGEAEIGEEIGESAESHEGRASSGLHVLTVRGVVAFLTLFGWGGLCLYQMGLPGFLAVFIAIPIGFAGMVGIALIVREALRLQYDGTLDPRNALGLPGEVYLTVPPARSAPGKVNVLVQEQLREFEAVTDSAAPIPTGASVTVVGLADGDTLVVEPGQPQPTDS